MTVPLHTLIFSERFLSYPLPYSSNFFFIYIATVSVCLSSNMLIRLPGNLLPSTAAVQKITGQVIFLALYFSLFYTFVSDKNWKWKIYTEIWLKTSLSLLKTVFSLHIYIRNNIDPVISKLIMFSILPLLTRRFWDRYKQNEIDLNLLLFLPVIWIPSVFAELHFSLCSFHQKFHNWETFSAHQDFVIDYMRSEATYLMEAERI